METYSNDRTMLLKIIRTKECYITSNCITHFFISTNDHTVQELAICPLATTSCKFQRNRYYYERGERYNIIQQAIRMYIERYGRDQLFEELL